MPKSNLATKIELPTTVTDELRFIQSNHNGTLQPHHVVEYAKDPETLLHSKFEWEDSVAGHQYRLWQARKVISLELVVVDRKSGRIHDVVFDMDDEKATDKPTRAFISLRVDRRGNDAVGYRSIEDVMSDEDLRRQLLNDAKNDMNLFRRKYHMLKELSDVFDAMNKV